MVIVSYLFVNLNFCKIRIAFRYIKIQDLNCGALNHKRSLDVALAKSGFSLSCGVGI